MNWYIRGILLVSLFAGFDAVGAVIGDCTTRTNIPAQPMDDAIRDFPVQTFDEVNIGDAFTVTIKAGNAFSVKASGRAQDLDAMEVNTRKGTLTIRYKPVKMGKDQNPVINRETVTVTVTLPELKKADFQKLARFTIEGFKRSAFIELTTNNLSTGSADLNADRVKLTMNGRSSVTVRGETGQLEASLQGQSELLGYSLQTRSAIVAVGGMSKAQVSATDVLQATANGSSQVTYKGQPSVKAAENDSSTIKASTL